MPRDVRHNQENTTTMVFLRDHLNDYTVILGPDENNTNETRLFRLPC